MFYSSYYCFPDENHRSFVTTFQICTLSPTAVQWPVQSHSQQVTELKLPSLPQLPRLWTLGHIFFQAFTLCHFIARMWQSHCGWLSQIVRDRKLLVFVHFIYSFIHFYLIEIRVHCVIQAGNSGSQQSTGSRQTCRYSPTSASQCWDYRCAPQTWTETTLLNWVLHFYFSKWFDDLHPEVVKMGFLLRSLNIYSSAYLKTALDPQHLGLAREV